MTQRSCLTTLLIGPLQSEILWATSQGPQLTLQDRHFSSSVRSPGELLDVMVFLSRVGQKNVPAQLAKVHLNSG